MNDTQKLEFIIEELRLADIRYIKENFSKELRGQFLHSEISAIIAVVNEWEQREADRVQL